MKNLLLVMMLSSSAVSFSQTETGIHFEHKQSWSDILAKAKAENKYIFVDAFTTWCGPCRMMANTIFPQQAVGEFFNEKYINVKVQLDTTEKDNEDVKKWYADANHIMTKYRVVVYPTYLFLSPDGELVHRAVGSSEADAFIAKGKDALDTAKQYYTLQHRYESGERSATFLHNLAKASLDAYDREAAAVYSKEYLATQKDLFTEDNIKFINDFTQSIKDPGFSLMVKNTAAFDKVLGEGTTDEILKGILLREEVYPKISGAAEPGWDVMQASINSIYPKLASELTNYGKILYSRGKGDWQSFSTAVTAYMKNYGSRFSPNEMNEFAWNIFESCNDIACIKQALEWSKKSVDLTNNPMFIDTYANLLYKTGKKAQAIKWEQKAVAIAKDKKEDTTVYEDTLEKMNKGEKTW